MQIDRVDPASIAEQAGLILREAWPAPVLHYTAEYLSWQFGFPGAPAIGLFAHEEGEPAGFVAATPRRFRYAGAATDGYILSFLGVRPRFQGRGLAGKLYHEILVALRESRLPGVIFVEARSASAQHLLVKTCERLAFKLKKLSQCHNYGFMRRGKADPPPAIAVEARPLDALGIIEACAAGQTLWGAPDRAALEHALGDPRGRKLFVAQEGERAVGAASVFLSEITTAKGPERVATVDTVFLPEPTGDRVAALLRAAAGAFAGSATAPVVGAPNLATIPAELLKIPGLRRTGATFDGFVLHGEGHPCLDAEVTNLEVV